MKHIPVINSSNIASLAYDETTKVLEVKFQNGSHYAYDDVPPNAATSLLATAPDKDVSTGKHFNGMKGKYKFRKL